VDPPQFLPQLAPQLDAVYEHGLAYARSQEFYDTTLLWQWMRFPGDVVFALGALLMAWDFLVKLRPLSSPALWSAWFRVLVSCHTPVADDYEHAGCRHR